ncbi:MAG: molybdenum ABC transporter ATP-binding protein [Caulobacterales bacterium]
MTAASPAGPTIEARFEGQLGVFHLNAAFTIPAKGITALVGPSGCGKTSLLRCIAGLTRLPGFLRVGDEVWRDERRFLAPHQRAIGYVFQETSLLAHLSVRRNLMFGFARSRDRSKIGFEEVVSLLSMGELLDRSTERLSGGERQRVAIGRALLSQPALLLMDEPLSSLDAQSKGEILPYLERLHQALSIPVIYVSHDVSEVARLADRVLTMEDGRVRVPEGDSRLPPASQMLKGLDQDQIARLAIAALLAGLGPAEPTRNGD